MGAQRDVYMGEPQREQGQLERVGPQEAGEAPWRRSGLSGRRSPPGRGGRGRESIPTPTSEGSLPCKVTGHKVRRLETFIKGGGCWKFSPWDATLATLKNSKGRFPG